MIESLSLTYVPLNAPNNFPSRTKPMSLNLSFPLICMYSSLQLMDAGHHLNMSTKGAACKHLAVLECVLEISEEHQKEIVKRDEKNRSANSEKSGKYCHRTCDGGEEMEK
ncbi:hypothetical protein MTR_1g033610 [Medicago truncatula]|uniref:Uncharacterized protein n=1 Tax=Medicago truncatula TaxID=3880 RepID=A0A072VGH5_MEDTR|nr:hypothetical protein MTR_1g033610 [Medicago truncatula]